MYIYSTNPDARQIMRYESDKYLYEVAVIEGEKWKEEKKKGNVISGFIGAANIWNNEIDRINMYVAMYINIYVLKYGFRIEIYI
jgi:hypothetical protein